MNEYKIPKSEQDNVMGAFWFMLRECEERAFDQKDPILKHFVESYYETWNRVTGDQKKPRWSTND